MVRYLVLLLFITYVQVGQAAASSESLSLLKTELMSLLARVEALEAENRALKKSAITNDSSTDLVSREQENWTQTVKVKGDFRYRYENIDAERSDTRERNRIRARLAVTAKPADNIEVGIGLASGSDDAVSTNQTLGSGGSTKDINLDLAYFKWQATEDIQVLGGKTKNIFYRPAGHGLLWDGDYRPEGLGLSFVRESYFVRAAANFLESDTKRDKDKTAYGLQTGFKGMSGDTRWVAGAGYFKIDTKNTGAQSGNADDFYGNTFSCLDADTLSGCTYSNDFEELEIFAQLNTKVGETPLVLFVDFVQNQDAKDLDTAWAAGLKLGKASSPGTWELGYTYQDVEADALLGLVTDSDFAGGGTDANGYIVRGAWAVNKQWKIGFTYFDNQRNRDVGDEEDYRRLMLDTAFKF